MVLVAGILAKTEKKEESWKQVATTLDSRIHSNSESTMEQSYQDLPRHLKLCFLHSRKCRRITRGLLKTLWFDNSFHSKFSLYKVEFMLRKTPTLLELICKFKGIIRGQFYLFDFPILLQTLHIFPTLYAYPRQISENWLLDCLDWAFRTYELLLSYGTFGFWNCYPLILMIKDV